MKLGPDGSWTIVLSRRDPGVPNWVSTADRRRGLIQMSVSAAGASLCNPARGRSMRASGGKDHAVPVTRDGHAAVWVAVVAQLRSGSDRGGADV
ncbi:MAG: hypothetical protein E2O73_10370 [Deltaproteobacteria bacterium]|nr:MAG: hypothetical protein E2O73_10370 [Deltaproteobacteria bacterium]